MRIKRVCLLKTPLSSDYKNVFDFNNEVIQDFENKGKFVLREAFYMNFPNIEITNIVTKSIKISNNKTQLTIRNSFEEIKFYNYCIISDKDENPYFFFIENLTSENDNLDNPSVTLNLLWDSWHNNINLMTNKISLNKIVKKHCTRYFKSGDKIYPLFYSNDNLKLKTFKKEISDNLNLLFAKISLDKNIIDEDNRNRLEIIGSSSVGNYTSNNLNNLSQKTNRIVLYIPLCLYDRENNIYKNCKIQGKNYNIEYYNETDNKNEIITLYSEEFNTETINVKGVLDFFILGKDSSYIDNIEFTFNSPFNYIIGEDKELVQIQTLITLCNLNIGINCYTFLLPQSFTSQNNKNYNRLNKEIPEEINKDLIVKYDRNIDYLNIIEIPLNIDTSPYSTIAKYNEPKLYIYPYKYITVVTKNNEIVLSPNFDIYEFKIIFDFRTYTPKFNIQYNNKYLFNEFIPLNTSGSLSYCIKAIDDYNIRNGTQRMISLSLQTISSVISSIMTRSVKPLVPTIESFINEYAIRKDLETSPAIDYNTDYAEDDILYQDRFRMYINSVNSDTIEYKQLVDNIYYYGYDVDEIGNIFENTRFYFDYCKTENCILNIPINNEDKKVIENIFNNGVFKFHINMFDTYLYKGDFQCTKNKNNNIELSIVDRSL